MKATVTFRSEDGREILIPVEQDTEGALEIKVEFGAGGEKIHEESLHHALSIMFFNALSGIGDVQE